MKLDHNGDPLIFDGSDISGTYPLNPEYRIDVYANLDTELGYFVKLQRREVYTNDRTGEKKVEWEDVVYTEAELSPSYTARDLVIERGWLDHPSQR